MSTKNNDLTQKQKAVNSDTWQHIYTVQKYLNACIIELMQRGEKHDQSKLVPPEVELFAEYTDKLAGCSYDSDEYNKMKAAMQPALQHHYANNRHHPEFYLQEEVWRPVVGLESSHEVSNFGNVRSLTKLVHNKLANSEHLLNGRLIKSYINHDGYCRIQLKSGDKKRHAFVHTLVAEAFIPNPNKKPKIEHIDGIKTNNRVSNLEWIANSEDLQHSCNEGLRDPTIKWIITCEELGISTFGFDAMVEQLNKLGYEQVSNDDMVNAVNNGKYLDLTFTTTRCESWINSPISDMNLIDLLEMLCDWKAASERHHDGDIKKSLKINCRRFRIDPQMASILSNTIDAISK